MAPPYTQHPNFSRDPDYKSFSRLSLPPDNPVSSRAYFSGGYGGLGGIPEGAAYEKDGVKEMPKYRNSVASKTLYEPMSPPTLIRKKSVFPWQKKKQQEREAMEREQHNMIMRQQQREQEEREARQRLERQLQEERQKREQFENEQRMIHQQQEERRLAEEESARRMEQERISHEQRYRRELERRRKANSPAALRNLRELIRTRYELDMEIYRLKDVRGPDRPFVMTKMKRADAIMHEILAIVSTWEENPDLWSQREWELAVDVRNRLLDGGKRDWANNPPWDEA